MPSFSLLELLPFIAAGFAAQLVDGALGMAFGVISNSLLMGLGVAPAAASAGVHTVETFTTCVSGISHIIHRNVDWKLLGRLTLPGIIGAAAGAYLLSQVDGSLAKPFVLAYLALIGLFLAWRGLRCPPKLRQPKVIAPLGLVGGFLDAAGGGGWGPVVTGNLLLQGADPRKTIGTVNTSEFLVTLTSALTFIAALGLAAFTIATLGLLIGGVIAAPLGAWLVKRISPRPLLVLVGILLTMTSIYGIYRALA
jgi:uncharacterized membrane protein YfcA